jgi:hypothetical protein
MNTFLRRFGALVLGCLCGLDRIRFRGSKRTLCYPQGIQGHLHARKVLLRDFKGHALATTEALFQAIEPPAKRAGLYRYLNSNRLRPEQVALRLAEERKQTHGLIAVLGRVEPCQTIAFRKDPPPSKWWTPYLHSGAKCLHYYHYYLDPDFGLRYTRLQTWFPFTMHIGINGRDWLARQMTKAGIRFHQKENCFTWVEDVGAAQRLLDAQLTTDWPALLQTWAGQSNPIEDTFLQQPVPYYWTVQEAEYASDILFHQPADLSRLYPGWVQYAYATLKSSSLLRYLDYRVRKDDTPCQGIPSNVKTTVKAFPEGTCVRQRVQGNVLKMYDKAPNVLRVETLLTDIGHFKSYRTGKPVKKDRPRYLPLRKGVADLHRQAEICQKINERYVQGLATVEETKSVAEVSKGLGERTTWKGRTHRALNPLAPEDVQLLESVNRGAFMLHGFRNRDIRAVLYSEEPGTDAAETKRRSARVTRLLTLLRAHGLIARVPTTHRYQVTEKGRTTITALIAARRADAKALLKTA